MYIWQAGGDCLRKAVDLVAKEQDPALTHQLTQHLEGQQPRASAGAALVSDDTSANSTYLVLLYMALGRHEEAAEVAVGLARRAQEAGNYKVCTSSCHLHHTSQQLCIHSFGHSLVCSFTSLHVHSFNVQLLRKNYLALLITCSS